MTRESLRARVLVVDRTGDLTEQLRLALASDERPEIVHLRKTTALVDVFSEEGPWDAVVAGPSEESGAGLRRLAEVREADPGVGLMVTVNGKEPADLNAFVKARPDELVRVPANAAALRNGVLTSIETANARRGAAHEAVHKADTASTRLGRVYTVGGPSGGCGKTTVATSLAAMLARDPEAKVVLVDLDVQFGEVVAALQLRASTTLYDVLFDEHDEPADDAAVAEALAASLTDTRYGFKVLPAPSDPAQADAVGAPETDQLLTQLRNQFDYVVVDSPRGLREMALAALDHSDHLVVVSQVDVPGLSNLKIYLAMLDMLGVEQRSTILNKELPDSGVSGADAVEVLGPVAATLPFSLDVQRALNEGRPFCEAYPQHPAARTLHDALAHLLPEAAQAAPESGDQGASRWWPWRKTS